MKEELYKMSQLKVIKYEPNKRSIKGPRLKNQKNRSRKRKKDWTFIL